MIKPGIEATARSLAKLPNQSTPIVHIAGTNGKGSTSAFVDGLLASFGYRVGRFNSPHLVEEKDSICVDGRVVDKQLFDTARERLPSHDSNYSTLTNFEKLTVTAFAVFSGQRIDVGVVEVGMGGLLDATNAFSRDKRDSVAVITPIALDHQSWLGDSVEEITKQKMGIITSQTKAAVVAPQIHPQVVNIIRERCSELGVPLYINGDSGVLRNPSTGACIYSELKMSGKHQLDNASTALLTLHALQTHCAGFKRVHLDDSERISHTLSQVRFRGRSDTTVVPGAIVDGAHNPAAIKLLRETLPAKQSHQFVLGFSQDKEVDEMLSLLIQPSDKVIFVPFSTPQSMPWVRHMSTRELQKKAEGIFGGSVQVSIADSVQDALKECKCEVNVVITGSLYLIADVYRLFD